MTVTDLSLKDSWSPKRKSKRWQVDYRDNSGKRQRKRFDTKREALAHDAQVRDELNKGSYVDPRKADQITVGALWKMYRERLATHGATGRRPTSGKTLQRYDNHAKNYVLPRWEHTRLSSITHDDVASWLTGLASVKTGKLAGAPTRESAGKLFQRLLEFAVTQGMLVRNPAKDRAGRAPYIPGKDEIAKESKDHVYLSAVELVRLAAACKGYEDFILLAGTCGLRWGEITALRVEDVDLTENTALASITHAFTEQTGLGIVDGPTKTYESRKVPIPNTLLPQLRERVADKASGDLVFTTIQGKPLRNGNFTKRYLKPAAEVAARSLPQNSQVSKVHFHSLRHTAVSLAIRNGVNIKVVQRIAGHADATMTLNVYAGLFDDDLHDSAQRLDARLREVQTSILEQVPEVAA